MARRLELLRRLSHWLMKEPDLEEEALRAHQDGRNLVIERQTLADAANAIELTTPSGKVSQIALQSARPGVFSAAIPATETGLYVLKDGPLTAFAVTGTADQKEFADVRATASLMQPVASATGSGIAWLEDGMPRLSKAKAGALASGSGWMALTDNQQFRVLSVRETPLFSTLLSLAALLAALSFMWYREGR